VSQLALVLERERIPFEAIVVNDNSTDATLEVAQALAASRPEVRLVDRRLLRGFGRAVRAGLEEFRGDAVVLVMADRSDDPEDVVRYYRKLEEGYDCVFGSRFRPGSRVVNYPPVKRLFNRLVNKAIQLLFWTRFNDLTNAFKAYRREVVLACGPYSSSHFNITIEMSLSALIRRYTIAEIPVHWYGRTWGASNLSLTQMGRRYLSALLKVYFEKLLVSDDILEERVARREHSADRLAMLERRVEKIEETVAGGIRAPRRKRGEAEGKAAPRRTRTPSVERT
ncbi:MAG: glycosyltransferase family 2 protein, partial [Deltaproteobacteria bacterium]